MISLERRREQGRLAQRRFRERRRQGIQYVNVKRNGVYPVAEYLQRWRTKTKLRAIQAMGGKCVCCGYDRPSLRIYHFHHLDPKTKKFQVGDNEVQTWSLIVAELRKCVLLCSNCHAEVHDGLRTVPLDAARFDEQYAEYRQAA